MSIPYGYIFSTKKGFPAVLWDEDRDMTQEQIAAYLGMKQSQYSRYERGLRDVPSDVLIRLALLYNTSTDFILGLTDDPRPYRR